MKIGLLAGGQGKRLKMGPKAFVEIAGKPMWQWLVEELAPLTNQPFVMVASSGTPEIEGVERVDSRGKYLTDLLALIQQKPKDDSILVINADAV